MKKNSNRNISGFTLVELIVVIVILGVLSTIGFVSYVGYLEGVRDTNRISQVSNMQSGLEVLRSKDSFVPLPDDSVQVLSDTGSILTYQGYAGENIVNTINYSKSGKDPQSGSYYTYSVSADKKYFQIMAFLEEQANVTAFNINQAKAIDYTNFYSYVAGDKLGILTQTGTNTPVQEITSIKTAGSLNLTTDTTNSYIVTSSNTRNITATGSSITSELNLLLTKIKSRGKNITYTSCKDILDKGASTGDGTYTINPNGTNLTVYCDMTTDGGGWTRYVNIKGNWAKTEALECFKGASINSSTLECFNPNYHNMVITDLRLAVSGNNNLYKYTLSDGTPSYTTNTIGSPNQYRCSGHDEYFTVMDNYTGNSVFPNQENYSEISYINLGKSYCKFGDTLHAGMLSTIGSVQYVHGSGDAFGPGSANYQTSAQLSEFFIR